jgi:ATP adenylyltransferase
MSRECLFCTINAERMVSENELAFAMLDAFPVTPLHMLIIPKRHARDFFSLSRKEVLSCNSLIGDMREFLLAEDHTIEGFNIGMNCGEVAGQTIFHCHIHLIPRRRGDVENPRGGVRHLIPGKGYY